MAQIKIKKARIFPSGEQFFPITHTKAVIDDNGYTTESRLGAMQDEINQAQLEVGAVPSDLTPTENSSNWVTSGGVRNALDERTLVQKEITLTLKDGWATDTAWTKNAYYNKHAVIPVDSIGGSISIKANATKGGRYGFLSSYPSTITSGSTVAWCSGTGRYDIGAGETVTVEKTDFPEDCQYVYIGVANTTASDINDNYLPQAVIYITNLKDDVLDIKRSIYKESEPIAIDINSYGSVHVWRTNSSWTNTYTGKFIPVTPKAFYIITANAENDSICIMTQDNTTNPSLATGSNRVTISAGQTTTLTAPDDAMFLWISDTASVVRLPQSIRESEILSIDTIEKILPLVKEIPNLLPLPKEMPNTIDTNNYQAIHIGPAGSGKWMATTEWYGKFVPINGYTHIYMEAGNAGMTYCLLTDGSHASGQNVSYAEGYSGNGRRIQPNTSVTVEIPSGASFLYYFVTSDNYSTVKEPKKIILLNELVCRDELDDSSNNKFPTYIEFGENEGVMYTIDNFIMKHIYENEVEYLCFSTDLGKNWIQVENTFDTRITHAHYFIDGTLLMCTPTKCYWTKDFQTFTESVMYDYDGSLFQPESGTRFYNIPKFKENRTFVNNEEWHLWGDYIITTTKPRLWYTKDNGRTIRAAYAFGLSSIDGTVYSARHIHAFEYNPFDEHFYAFTGDSATECHIIKGQYNNGTWTWEHIVTGALWKLTSPVFFKGYFAAVTDYTDSSLSEKKGLIRCPVNAISEENICYLFKATSSMMGNAALSGYIYDKNGWRVMTCDYRGGDKVLVAKNNYDFTWVYNTNGERMSSFIGPNANGDVYVFYRNVGASVSGEDWLRINGNTFNFTKAIRDAGASNFFDYRITEF